MGFEMCEQKICRRKSVPPRLYGGTERLASYLSDELVRLGGAGPFVPDRLARAVRPGDDRGSDGVRDAGSGFPPGFCRGNHRPTCHGAIVDTMDEAVIMLPRVIALDRRAVRRRFEQRFSSVRMAKDYVAVYRSLLKWPSIQERATTVPLTTGFRKRVECIDE